MRRALALAALLIGLGVPTHALTPWDDGGGGAGGSGIRNQASLQTPSTFYVQQGIMQRLDIRPDNSRYTYWDATGLFRGYAGTSDVSMDTSYNLSVTGGPISERKYVGLSPSAPVNGFSNYGGKYVITSYGSNGDASITIWAGYTANDPLLLFSGDIYTDRDLFFGNLDCSGYAHGGKLTTVTFGGGGYGQVVCADDYDTVGSGGGGSSLAVTTGTAAGFNLAISSPTSALNFNSSHFSVSLKANTTAFVSITDIPAAIIRGTHLDLSSTVDTSGSEYMVSFDTTTNRPRPFTPITTFYFEQSREAPRFVQSTTNNAFWIAASTDPYFGLMAFSNSVSSESNCGYFPMPSVRDYNTGIDFRLDEFRVVNGTGTDSGAQRYMIAVASKTNVSWQNSTYSFVTNVDLASTLGTVSGTERALATTTTLTSWNTIIGSGVPWCVKVCRDGDDATNDSSSTNSFFSMLTIRAGNTNP